MGAAAVVMSDMVTAQCAGHQIPSPSGSPMPAPPMPFSAPLTSGLATTVLIGNQPAAVAGSSGTNLPPHVGLHPSDPYLAPSNQLAQVMVGSSTVYFDGQQAAYSGCTVTACFSAPAMLNGSGATVLIGT